MASVEGGYEDERFQRAVPDNLHCAICLNVLKQPMQCTRNEHFFCQPCITRHLQQSQTCPTCIEPLTIQTLRPSRFVKDLVSKLMICCDNASRGCAEIVKLEALEGHVANCAFNPVQCSNDGCELIVNRKDQQLHEINNCNFAERKCEVCGKDVARGKRPFHCFVTRTEVNEVESTVGRRFEEIKDEISNAKGMLVNLSREMTRCVRGMNDEMNKMKREINVIKKELESANEQQQSIQHRNYFSSLLTSLKATVNVREDIVIAGGHDGEGLEMNDVDKLSWSASKWFPVQPMVENRCSSSSFFFRGKMVVCGGVWRHDMEELKLEEENAQWKKFPAMLPREISGHTSVAFDDKLYVFGGRSAGVVLDAIFEVLLVPPYSCQIVGHMPEARTYHGGQRYGDKVIIVGGTTTGATSDAVTSVLLFDMAKKSCQSLAPLPFAVSYMATIAWKDNIIIMGGMDREGKTLNTVLKYNVAKEKGKMLPSMKHKREACTAVLTQNVIVVMGGENEEEGYLSSVESFNLDLYSWNELPNMSKKKKWGTAVVKG